jgi:hypothetical protein
MEKLIFKEASPGLSKGEEKRKRHIKDWFLILEIWNLIFGF